MKIKKLFKLWGEIWWIDKEDCRNFIFIPESEAIFRWAETKERVVKRFKEILRNNFKKKKFKYPVAIHDIYFHSANIEEVKFKRENNQKQKKLPFPKIKP